MSGVASALGEVAFVNPIIAGWGPPLALAVIVLGWPLRDGWKAPRRAAPG